MESLPNVSPKSLRRSDRLVGADQSRTRAFARIHPNAISTDGGMPRIFDIDRFLRFVRLPLRAQVLTPQNRTLRTWRWFQAGVWIVAAGKCMGYGN